MKNTNFNNIHPLRNQFLKCANLNLKIINDKSLNSLGTGNTFSGIRLQFTQVLMATVLLFVDVRSTYQVCSYTQTFCYIHGSHVPLPKHPLHSPSATSRAIELPILFKSFSFNCHLLKQSKFIRRKKLSSEAVKIYKKKKNFFKLL